MILRPYQQDLKNAIYSSWQNGNRYVLGVLPTGGGKSPIVSDIVLDRHNMGSQQVVIAHRTELVSQMAMHVARRGIPHQIIAPKDVVQQVISEQRTLFGKSFVNPRATCSVAAVDTLNARADVLKNWALQQDFWTIDEAHHVLAENKWGRAVTMFPRAYGLGVTATPGRADGMGLGAHSDGVFHDMVLGPSVRQLIEIGAITDYEYVVPQSDFQIDETAITPSGDFSQNRMAEASKKSRLVGDVVLHYCTYALGKQTIVFAINIEDAKKIVANFEALGISARCVSSKSTDAYRTDSVKRFRNGTLQILVNVDLFGEGFDVPACECVIMARPTASLSVFLQQAGRALRPKEGKLFGIIIDPVSNYKRHRFPDSPRIWTLDRRSKKEKKQKDPEEIELKVCSQCTRVHERSVIACPHCGFIPVIAPRERTLETVDGDLMLLDRATLERMRQNADLESPASVAGRVSFVAGEYAGKAAFARQNERIEAQKRLEHAIAVWAGWQRAKGRPDQESYRRFYLTTGVDVITARTLPKIEMEKLTAEIEAWSR